MESTDVILLLEVFFTDNLSAPDWTSAFCPFGSRKIDSPHTSRRKVLP
jgi:hypothetical protein